MDRLLSLLAAMLFAVPSAFLLWIIFNKQLAWWGDGSSAFSGNAFWGIVAVFALVALFFPKLFPELLSAIWQVLIKIVHWF